MRMGFTSSPPPDDSAPRAEVKIVLPKDAPRDASGKPTPEAIAQARVVMGETIERLFGQASDAVESQQVAAYIADNAQKSADIASYHAHRVSRDFARLRTLRAGAVDRWLSERQATDELAKDERALSRLIDAVEREAKGIVEYAWHDEDTIPQTMLEGCRIVGEEKHPEEATDEHPEGTVTLSLEAARVIHTNAVAPEAVAGMLRPDARLAERIEAIGNAGRESAERMREASRERWRKHKEHQSAGISAMIDDAQRFRLGKPFAPAGEAFDESALWALWLCLDDLSYPPWIRATIQAVWLDVVRPTLERARAKPAALVHAVYEPAAHLFSRVRREEERNGQRSLILPGDTVARIATSAAAIGSETINALMVDRGLKLFGTVTAHRVLRWQIFRAHQQALEGNPDPRVVRVPGGYRALTHEELGIKSKAEEGNVRDIIEAMHATELPMPPNNAYTRLLIRTVYPAQGRRPGRLELVLGTMLLPDYVQELQQAMGHSLQARSALRLVPVLPLPPFVGREREYGPQATLSMLVVAHIRGAGRELIEQGGAKLDAETLARLAASSGLPAPLVPALIDRWTQDGDDGPALLKRVDKDRFTLGDAHKDARDFIEEGCKREHDGAIGGQRSAAKRAKDIERLGRKGSRGR